MTTTARPFTAYRVPNAASDECPFVVRRDDGVAVHLCLTARGAVAWADMLSHSVENGTYGTLTPDSDQARYMVRTGRRAA